MMWRFVNRALVDKMSGNLVEMFRGLSPAYKAGVVAGVGGLTFAIGKSLFSSGSSKIPGFPTAKNLKGFGPSMTRKEAQLILALPQNFTKQDVQKRHRIMMALNHPDKGGSSYVAAKINESKDCLLLGTK